MVFREQFRRFVETEVTPNVAAWNEAGRVPRAIWKRMGEEGYLGANMPEAWGGAGGDFLYDAIVMEELAYARAHCLQASLHTDICLPYLESYGTEEQKQRYLAPAIEGDCLVAIAMTEPSTGSDLAAVRTTAIRDGSRLERAFRDMARAWAPWRAVAARLLWAYYRIEKQREGIR